MASKGRYSKAGEWWKHLRPHGRRRFWKRERVGAKKDISQRTDNW